MVFLNKSINAVQTFGERSRLNLKADYTETVQHMLLTEQIQKKIHITNKSHQVICTQSLLSRTSYKHSLPKKASKMRILFSPFFLILLSSVGIAFVNAEMEALHCEFVLHALAEFSLISKKGIDGKTSFNDMLNAMLN